MFWDDLKKKNNGLVHFGGFGWLVDCRVFGLFWFLLVAKYLTRERTIFPIKSFEKMQCLLSQMAVFNNSIFLGFKICQDQGRNNHFPSCQVPLSCRTTASNLVYE